VQSLDASTFHSPCGSVDLIRRTEASPVPTSKSHIIVLALLASGGVTALGLATTSCSSTSSSSGPATDDAGSVPKLLDASCTAGGLTISFNPMYSAFDGTHTFQVPAVVFGSTAEVTWFGDSSIVGMQSDGERPNEVLITMLKAGTTTIHVQSADGKCASAPLTISAAMESDWEIGSMRYNDGLSVHLAGPAKSGTGSPLESDGMVGPACTNCHGETATNSLYKDVSHTPEQTGGFSDADLLGIILTGNFPADKLSYFDPSVAPYPVWQYFHKWQDITADQQPGIIAYLRSLTPAPQKGQPNFGYFDTDAGMTVIVTDAAADAGADVNGVESGPLDASDEIAVVEETGAEAAVEAGAEASVEAGSEAGADAEDDGETGSASEAGDGATE
jgi:hypothetical protein